MLTGRITTLTGDARINAAGDAVQPARPVARRRPHARVQLLRVGFVARVTDAHGQRRPALRAAEPVLSDQRQLHDADDGGALRRVRRRQHLQAGHADRHAAAVRPLSRRASTPTTPIATTVAPSVGAAWQVPPSTGVHEVAARQRGRRRRRSRRLGDGVSSVPACRTSPACSATTRASRSTLQTRSEQPRRCRSCCATIRRCRPRPPVSLPAAPGVDHHTRQRLRSEHPAALHAVVVGGLAAQGHERLGDRGALRRQQARERLGHGQHQRAQHHQQRLPQRVPPRAGQPAGQHRRRPRHDVRLHGRRHGHVAAADLPRALQRAERRQRRQRRGLHRRELDQRDVPRLPRRAQSESLGLRDRRAPAA